MFERTRGDSHTTTCAMKRREILVVDDNADTANLARMILGREGFNVQIAADGEQAIDLARTTSFDLVLLDVRLPCISGFEVCKALKTKIKDDAPVVLFFTVSDFHVDREKAIASGGDGYLVKPFRADDLVTHVKKALATRGR